MKPQVDVSNLNGSRWAMGRAVSEALEGVEANRFLSAFNDIAVEGSDDAVIAMLLLYADLVIDGDVVSSDEPARLPVVIKESFKATKGNPLAHGKTGLAQLATVGTLAIDTNADYSLALGVLAGVKATLEQIEDEKKIMTAGVRDTLKRLVAKYKPAIDAYTEAEKILKAKLVEYRTDIRLIRDRMIDAGEEPVEPVPEVEGVAVRDKIEITDIEMLKLPPKFWTRVPDEKLIKETLRAGKKVKGVSWELVETLAVTHKKVKR